MKKFRPAIKEVNDWDLWQFAMHENNLFSKATKSLHDDQDLPEVEVMLLRHQNHLQSLF